MKGEQVMTKRDYVILAEALRSVVPPYNNIPMCNAWDNCCQAIMDACGKQNPAFSEEEFTKILYKKS